MKTLATTLFVAIGLAVAAVAPAREIPRTEYLRYLPLGYPALVQRNPATEELHLYGDPSDPAYVDVAPRDGIDDRRGEVLMSLAVRFAPYLVQNTEDIPTDFDRYIRNRTRFPLHVDTWNISGEAPRLVDTTAINMAALGATSCDAGSDDDCALIALLDRFSPSGPRDPSLEHPLVRQRPAEVSVLYFDFPGSGEGTWKAAYEDEYNLTPADQRHTFPHAQVHPFLERVEDEGGTLVGYELVLQYWFFYPTNDGGNNHEGDWEHLNVLIAPRSEVDRPLSAETVARILSGDLAATDDAADPLVIRRTDYYFHHFVMTLDYTSPSVYQPRDAWIAEVRRRPKARLQEEAIWKHVRHMAYVDRAEQVVNTHPFAYIGADNKGLDQGLALPGGKNRDSHGTFPFPGRYTHIGPAGATELISVHVDPKEYWRKRSVGRASDGPSFERGRVLGLADRARLRLVPDWERIVDAVREDAAARRAWSWLVLPIRWGYPATESPFAGIVSFTDTGNAAPVGPSYSLGWNVSGSAPGFHSYEPHTLPSVFPLAIQDNFKNNLGFFNFTLPVLYNLPPLDFATRIVTYPLHRVLGRGTPVFYPRESVPFRFVGVSTGVSWQVFDKDFDTLALSPEQYDEFLGRIIVHLLSYGDSTTTVSGAREVKSDSWAPFYQVAFYIGDRFTSENTVRNARSSFRIAFDFSNIPSYRYDADVNLWEYAGSLRYNVLASPLRPYVKAGYGWSWYRLENVRANGVPFQPSKTEWIKPGGLWPTTWHYGLGLEYVPWRNIGKLPRGGELSFRVEYARYTHRLGLDLSAVTLDRLRLVFPTLGDVPGGDRVTRGDLTVGATFSF